MQDELSSQPSLFRLTRSSVLCALFCSLYRRTPHLRNIHIFTSVTTSVPNHHPLPFQCKP